MFEDVPSPIDLRLMPDAREWAASAMDKRPWRTQFFECFASEVAALPVMPKRLLELGSGPGFLARHLLMEFSDISYSALDFSSAMHHLARERLGELAARVQFVERNFKETSWSQDLGKFACVVTNQAVHELRHKRHATALHAQVRDVLVMGGAYLVCDHFLGEGGMKNEQLYMSISEQSTALLDAGFSKVRLVLSKGGLVLHHAV